MYSYIYVIMRRKVWRGESVLTMVGGAGLPRGEPSALFLYSLHSMTVMCFCIICVVKNLGGSYVWWFMPVISALGRWLKVNQKFESHLGAQWVETSLNYMRFSLKRKIKIKALGAGPIGTNLESHLLRRLRTTNSRTARSTGWVQSQCR